MLLFITSCHIDIWTYTWTRTHTHAHRQVDILVECVETKDADAQTVQYLHVSRRTLRVCVYDYDCVVSH